MLTVSNESVADILTIKEEWIPKSICLIDFQDYFIKLGYEISPDKFWIHVCELHGIKVLE